MESNYKIIYQSASIKDLEHSRYTLISDIEECLYNLQDIPDYIEPGRSIKEDLASLQEELEYVEGLIDLYNETQLNGLENQTPEQ